MIKLSGSRFTDIMPENLAEQPEIQALAYAVGRQVEKLLAYADGARTYAASCAGKGAGSAGRGTAYPVL
mgnify:CR=1 FL=1